MKASDSPAGGFRKCQKLLSGGPQSLKSVMNEVSEYLATERTALTAKESIDRNLALQKKLREAGETGLLEHFHD